MEKEQVMVKPTVLVCGYGIVGHHIAEKFKWCDLYDLKLGDTTVDGHKVFGQPPKGHYDYCFVCVPTPYTKGDGKADLTAVIDCVKNIDAGVIIIKSTIPPTTVDTLKKETGKHIVFSPEYNGATQHANVEYDFLVLGGDKEDTEKVCQLYQYVSNAYLNIYQTTAVTAELCKYMENTFLATKVTMCNEFYRLAKKLGINYNELRECFCADPRVNKSHTFVYEKYPYYDSKCFNKDLPALVRFFEINMDYSPKFIKAVIERNNDFMKECGYDNELEK